MWLWGCGHQDKVFNFSFTYFMNEEHVRALVILFLNIIQTFR